MPPVTTPEELNLPWAPIFTVNRSDLPELTVYGIVFAWAEERALYSNAGISLLRIGNTRSPLWSRSLLKPFQFMVLYPVLKEAYPNLTDRHFAMMMASHQSDETHVELLNELLQLGGLSQEDLQCPACMPMNPQNTGCCNGLESRLNHPCSGKHLGTMLYLKARNLPVTDYLNPELEPYVRVRELLEYLLNRDIPISAGTVDGCGMPNYTLSPVEAAQLYHALVMPVPSDVLKQAPEELSDILEHWEAVSRCMRGYPEIIGGEGRLDTRLIQGAWPHEGQFPVLAKEGADGLLVVGIGANPRFADGLGLYIKLSAGYQAEHLETIVFELLQQMGLKTPELAPPQNHLKREFHFQIDNAIAKA